MGLLIGGGFGCVNGGVGLMGFGVALVVGGGSWRNYGFSGSWFVGFYVLEVVVVCVWCSDGGDRGVAGFFFGWLLGCVWW